MITKRNIGTVAALGGVTAVVALLTGLPSAGADELSDAQAKNQLLQQRLDQLAQAPISPVGGLYPGGCRRRSPSARVVAPGPHRSPGDPCRREAEFAGQAGLEQFRREFEPQ